LSNEWLHWSQVPSCILLGMVKWAVSSRLGPPRISLLSSKWDKTRRVKLCDRV